MFSFSALLFLFTACDPDKDNNFDPCKSNFDQESLFVNVADNLILPAYTDLVEKTTSLQNTTSDFKENPSETSLAGLKKAFKVAYLAFQKADLYEFGPAEEVLFRSNLNNFPVNTGIIDKNLENGTWDLEKPDGFDRGFPALDYLLYGLADNDQGTIQFYIDNAIVLDYLTEVVALIAEKSKIVGQTWENGYRDQFVQNAGTAAGTSLSQMINGLNFHYELLKREKVGIPSGVVTLGFPNPDRVEAVYSGISLELIQAALDASGDLFNGLKGVGLDDYLKEVKAEKDGESLDVVINNQYKSAKAALNALIAFNIPFAQVIEDQNESVVTAYNELVKQIVNIKTDLPSVLCVSITYVDNPSDSD